MQQSGGSMTNITLIFPDQLFLKHPGLHPNRPVYLLEEFLFFKVQPFHKQRLVLLRSAMQQYAETLRDKQYEVHYIPSEKLTSRGEWYDLLGQKKIKNIHIAEFADEWLSQDFQLGAKKHGWQIHTHPSPGFLSSQKNLEDFFSEKKHYSMAQFYAYQRKTLNILMENQRPIGGKYSFDTENRKKIPKTLFVPPTFIPHPQQVTKKILAQIEKEFPHAIGTASPFLYPSTHAEAKKALQIFLQEKIALFGDYQDAIDKEDSFLFHSILSPLLNIGLLTPQEIIDQTLCYAETHTISINSLEGFLRQIMGWREYVRASYLFQGNHERSENFFKHHQKIPKKFWQGNTGIVPIDTTIKRVLETGYCNHIERLMVLGNFLLLTETAPQEIYEWFTGHFVDAYDWVMVPNVYGMSQYADGGVITTKPYISSSNYILKMSNYPKGEWTEIWDGLFWRFLQKHHRLLSSNPRMFSMMQMLHKNQETILPKIKTSELWLTQYRS